MKPDTTDPLAPSLEGPEAQLGDLLAQAPSPPPGSFRERLEQARTLRGLTQQQLAEQLGYKHRSVVWHYENGSAKPNLELVAEMARVLNVDAVWLSGLSGDGQAPPKTETTS